MLSLAIDQNQKRNVLLDIPFHLSSLRRENKENRENKQNHQKSSKKSNWVKIHKITSSLNPIHFIKLFSSNMYPLLP